MNYLGWRTTQGVPQRWAILEGNIIVAFPVPMATYLGNPATWLARIGYVQQPALLTATSDTVDARIPFQVQPYLKYAAASWLLALDNSDATALQTSRVFMDSFIAYLGG
jgi:hypothetical protein